MGLALAMGLSTGSAMGCGDDEEPSEPREAMAGRVGDVLPVVMPADAPLPADREAILRELAPLPSASLLVVYEVEGPGGLSGSLEVLARPGGLRRENWTLQVPLGAEGERRLAGSTIQTPEGIWVEGSPPESITPSPLGALADAYLELEPESRRAFVERIRALQATLAEAREHDEGPTEQILGVPCHVTRVAAIEMCLWEATGLPLRYEGEGLRLRALNVDANASLGDGAFALPFVPPASPPGFDAPASLRRFVEGELAELAPLLHPGLRPFAST
ncbi:MAG: hypothetical protein H6712_30710 [Myxococcales bacterium]|nr:hypothetical protein [Myxococcales bacterium]MCB9718262.1 hypothetical protein [Myxococcales bacterium]